MEPSLGILETVLGPAAAFTTSVGAVVDELPWAWSYLNPINMVCRLLRSDSPDWEFFGSDLNGSRFFILPRFAIGEAPLRIDVYVLDQEGRSSALCAALGQHSSLLSPGRTLQNQAFTLHLLHALQIWSNNVTGFKEAYLSMPFGSRIVVENIVAEASQCRIHLLPIHEVELEWLSYKDFLAVNRLSKTLTPPELDISQLRAKHQSHEAITLVEIPERHGPVQFVFKSTYRNVGYLYHEIKALVSIAPHQNVISRPLYIVTKACRFGNKRGVCGFIQQYHPLGNLRDALRNDSALYSQMNLQTRYDLGCHVVSAMKQIRASPLEYFPDLKPDNVVLASSTSGIEAVIIDFEQRGAWCAWSPPEVYYVDYVNQILLSEVRISPDERQRLSGLLKQYRQEVTQRKEGAHYDHLELNLGWNALLADEKERGMVYMFGKLLWCLFEYQPTINCSLGAEIFREVNAEHRFPHFCQTPPMLRGLIAACTSGSKEWEGRSTCLVRVGDRLFPRGKTGLDGEELGTHEDVFATTKRWWEREVAEAEEFMLQRIRQTSCPVMENADRRPNLSEVAERLREFGRSRGFA